MVEKVEFLKSSLTAAIDGLVEIEAKARDMPEHMKSLHGMEEDEELDRDSPEDLKKFLAEALDSILR